MGQLGELHGNSGCQVFEVVQSSIELWSSSSEVQDWIALMSKPIDLNGCCLCKYFSKKWISSLSADRINTILNIAFSTFN